MRIGLLSPHNDTRARLAHAMALRMVPAGASVEIALWTPADRRIEQVLREVGLQLPAPFDVLFVLVEDEPLTDLPEAGDVVVMRVAAPPPAHDQKPEALLQLRAMRERIREHLRSHLSRHLERGGDPEASAWRRDPDRR